MVAAVKYMPKDQSEGGHTGPPDDKYKAYGYVHGDSYYFPPPGAKDPRVYRFENIPKNPEYGTWEEDTK